LKSISKSFFKFEIDFYFKTPIDSYLYLRLSKDSFKKRNNCY